MKILSVIRKSLKEQYRSFWLFILTVSSALSFVLIYHLIVASYDQSYRIDIINYDIPAIIASGNKSFGERLVDEILLCDTLISFEINEAESRQAAEERIKNRKSDVLVIIPEDFSERISGAIAGDTLEPIPVELAGIWLV